MNRNKYFALITTFAICLLPHLALAQERSWYLGLGAGSARADFIWPMVPYVGFTPPTFAPPALTPRVAGTVLGESTDDSATSFEALLGYRLTENFFVEAAWKKFDTFGGEAVVREVTTAPLSFTQSTAERTTRVSMDAEGGTLALGGSFPLSQRFSVFALAGGLYTGLETTESFVVTNTTTTTTTSYTNSDEETWSWFVGVGAEYSVTDRLRLRFAYRHYADVGTQLKDVRYLDEVENGGIDLRDASLALLFSF